VEAGKSGWWQISFLTSSEKYFFHLKRHYGLNITHKQTQVKFILRNFCFASFGRISAEIRTVEFRPNFPPKNGRILPSIAEFCLEFLPNEPQIGQVLVKIFANFKAKSN
jgi:hypothetical protein